MDRSRRGASVRLIWLEDEAKSRHEAVDCPDGLQPGATVYVETDGGWRAAVVLDPGERFFHTIYLRWA